MAQAAPIYMDNNATTRVDDAVLAEMLPYFTQKYGNAASKTHPYGWTAEDAVELARERVAGLIGSEPGELVFTSGATEGINLAIRGVYELYQAKGSHIITVQTEHKAVLDTCKALERLGASITYLPVDEGGLVAPADLEAALTEQTVLVSIMYANNETGVLQDIRQLADITHQAGSIFMSDATQAIGKIPVDVNQLGIDLMPLSGHKFYGPKGVGALYVRRRGPRVRLMPQIEGGGHEKGLRSGTLNVPGIVGLGKAAELAVVGLSDHDKTTRLRDQLQEALLQIPGSRVNGALEPRLPNTLNIAFEGINSQQLVRQLAETVAVSTGSACTSAIMEPSHVLKAMGVSDESAYGSVRLSLGRYNTAEEVENISTFFIDQISRLKGGI